MRDESQETLNLQKNLLTRQNWQALYTWLSHTTAWLSHYQALQELFQREWSKFCGAILWFWSALYGRMAVSMQIINCCLWQRALLRIMLLTYGPNYNTALPEGQKQTEKSLKKYSFSIFGVYSSYTITAQRLAEWPCGWLCSWSRASDGKELSLAQQRSLRDMGRGSSCLGKGFLLLPPQCLADDTSTAEIPMPAPFNIAF